MNAFIIGAGAQGRVILDILRAQGRHESITFVDDAPSLRGTEVNGAPVRIGIDEIVAPEKEWEAIIALGNPELRIALSARLSARGFRLLNAIHPSAVVMPTVCLGQGIMIGANAVVNSNAILRDSVIVNTGAVIEHDCLIQAGAAVGPGARLGGRVRVENHGFIAAGATVISRVSIGARTVVGAGAVVTKDLPADVLAVGVPARIRETTGPSFDWRRVL